MLRSSSPGDYTYDYTTPTTTTTTTRSTSPLHFLNPAAMAHLTHHHHHHLHCHSHRASAAATAADISRLLDPAYVPSSSSRSPTAVTAYVDPHGDLHDPDYRHFPITHHPHNQIKNHNGRRGASPRPHFDWEMEIDEHALDDEYEEEDSYTKTLNARYAPSTSRSWNSSSASTRPRESSFSTMSMYSPTYYSPTGTASTLPTSYEDDESLPAESPFDEKKEKKTRRLSKGDKEKERMKVLEKEREEKEREKEAEAEREKEQEKERERRQEIDVIRSSSQRRSHSHGRSPRSPRTRRRSLDLYEGEREQRPEDLDDEDDDSAHLHPGSSASRGSEHDYVPTCTQSIRRQWQALALSFRFSVFRAQKRMTRRVTSLTT